MNRTRIVVIAAVFACTAAATDGPAWGAMLDQSQETFNGSASFFPARKLAQTFAPEIGGQLDRVELLLNCDGPYTASIVETSGGAPGGSVLGAVTGGATTGSEWVPLDFLSEGVVLTVGQSYGIVLSDDQGVSSWWAYQASGDPYAEGSSWEYDGFTWTSHVGRDTTFRTYMVPEPTTLALLGLAALAVRRRRRR